MGIVAKLKKWYRIHKKVTPQPKQLPKEVKPVRHLHSDGYDSHVHCCDNVLASQVLNPFNPLSPISPFNPMNQPQMIEPFAWEQQPAFPNAVLTDIVEPQQECTSSDMDDDSRRSCSTSYDYSSSDDSSSSCDSSSYDSSSSCDSSSDSSCSCD